MFMQSSTTLISDLIFKHFMKFILILSFHLIPVRNAACEYLVKNGSHLMTLTRGGDISRILNVILKEAIQSPKNCPVGSGAK